MEIRTVKRVGAAAAVSTWVLVATWGYWSLADFAMRPGLAASAAPLRWPAQLPFERRAGGPTLVVVAHAQCGCTKATIAELERIAARCHGHLSAYVLLDVPTGLDLKASDSAIARAAAGIPGVTVVPDHGGRLATLFGARTSGQTFLYNAGGTLVFSGGITNGRSVEGDSAGAAAVERWAAGGVGELRTSSVYGCSLDGVGP